MPILFAVLFKLIVGKGVARWIWLAAAVHISVGVLVSEALIGWATETDLQPNVDGTASRAAMGDPPPPRTARQREASPPVPAC